MACASEDVLHEINDLSKDGLEQVNSEILSFESKEDFSNALEKFGKNPLTRTASSFISAENIYEEGSIDNESYNETIYNLFSNDISWNGGGYRVRDEFLNYYKDVVFSFSVNGDNIKPGLKISDNDFIGSPKIEACEAIVYTKDGGGWIGVKIIKELNN